MKSLIILKIGGSIITDKKSDEPKVDYENLERISKEIKQGYDSDKINLILIHGAGSYGHNIVKRTGINNGIVNKKQLVDFAETQRLQNELNSIITKKLIENGLPTIPCQASSFMIGDGGRLQEIDIEAIEGMLKIDMIPVLYGVPVYDKLQKCSILSGDQIAPYLARKLNAELIIHATNVNGIYTKDPNQFDDAEHISEITVDNFEEIKKLVSGSLDTDVTGGMLNKISELMNIGVSSQIISGIIPGNIIKALRGECIGTVVRGV
ncbi:MAG: isopentenyl phosphate kinase family protein [Nanoarchaeota archaeon]|nr:isopentenyl phosphate kinase family protein [Nanoarchaeota archaeon]